ncbi:plasmid partitioning protein RepB C-terminal domain-containing protein [Andreprevotia chitinilytica]|uniref:plasmid partitioning protein RepB C-terminal domain-containing protein n=1 Tax=Andreprevotia chitinilytica TaxID=396808 RepID=UPI00055840DC|nr:plasmid partitioning protein RepB C-terminal domain-containing protein [Andreprevotia chitinilytica]
MKSVQLAFNKQTILLPLDRILPTRLVGKSAAQTTKFQVILSSIRELGIIEPLAVHPENPKEPERTPYILLDGHLRLEALKQLGCTEAICLVATDDEGFTYNRQVNRVSAIQEHRMILAAINKGVSASRIAQVLNVNVDRIRERQHLLDGIAPEVVDLLKDKMVGNKVFSCLRKMKPIRQIEAAEMMISANRFTGPYAEMVLVATRPELLADPKKNKPNGEITPEDIARMEREMEKLHQDYLAVEDSIGDTMLTLVIAKGYISRLLRNSAITDYLDRHHRDLIEGLSAVMEAITTDARSPERE